MFQKHYNLIKRTDYQTDLNSLISVDECRLEKQQFMHFIEHMLLRQCTHTFRLKLEAKIDITSSTIINGLGLRMNLFDAKKSFYIS